MSKVNSQKLLELFQSSGLSQKKFAEQQRMSAPMVSYYLRKAKNMEGVDVDPIGFKQLVIEEDSDNRMVITTSNGVKIEIPL